MGYIAVARDPLESARLGRRDIVVAWRGTVTYLEWIHDLKDILTPAYFGDDASIKVESGFLDLYTVKEHQCNYCSFSAREQVLADIKRLAERFDGEELSITVTGHSLGTALALLSAYDIAEMGLNIREDGEMIPVTVFSYSGPRVGNLRFKLRCEELGVKVLRVINVHDRVPIEGAGDNREREVPVPEGGGGGDVVPVELRACGGGAGAGSHGVAVPRGDGRCERQMLLG